MAATQGVITSVTNDTNNAPSGGRGARLRELRNRSKDESGSTPAPDSEETSGEQQQQPSSQDKEIEIDHTQTGTNTGTINTTTTATTGTGATLAGEKSSLNPETPITTSIHEKEEEDSANKTTQEEPGTAKEQEHQQKSNGVKPTRTAEIKEKSATSSTPKPKQNTAEKPSFWSSLIRTLIPCIGPSKAHDLDVDVLTPKPKPANSTVTPPTTSKVSEKEKEKEKTPEPSAPSAASEKPVPPPLNTVPSLPLVPTPSSSVPTPPAVSADKEVIVPPTPPSHLLPPSETGGVTSGSVQAPGSTGEEGENYTDDGDHEGDTTRDSGATGGTMGYGISEEEEEERLILQGGAGIPLGPDGEPRPLLPNVLPNHTGRKCLVLDLDETLVHSSFKLIPQADYVVPVEIEHQFHNVYVIKRPGVDQFLQKMGELYEVVVFTASLSKYADPVLDKLDIHSTVTHRLFRESCFNHKGNYVKDLSQLGRPISQTIILDNSPASYLFHPNNAVPVSSWFNDPHDTELMDLCPFLGDLRVVDDVRGVLDGGL